MPSRRDSIRMTPDEVAAYLAGERRVILCTNGPDGMPHPVPMNYGVDDSGRIVMTSFAKSQKVLNLRRDARATLLVESGDTYGELRSVVVWCDVEIVEDLDEVVASVPIIQAGEAMAGSIDPARSEQVRASMAKRVLLRFTPFRTTSWDHSKLGGKY